MKNPADGVKGWEQLSLTTPGPRELILRIGTFPQADHAQFQIELREAGTHELVAMSSRPHVAWSEVMSEAEQWFEAVRAHLQRLDEPF